MGDHFWRFALQGLTHYNQVGTIFPCSKYAGEAVSRNISAGPEDIIVELGAGTGALTKPILSRMLKHQKLFCFEINPELSRTLLEIQDSRLEVITDRAENFPNYLSSCPAIVVSALPLTVMNRKERINLLTKVKDNLQSRGRFIQFQYSRVNQKEIKDIFGNVRIERILRNIPPGLIYICRND